MYFYLVCSALRHPCRIAVPLSSCLVNIQTPGKPVSTPEMTGAPLSTIHFHRRISSLDGNEVCQTSKFLMTGQSLVRIA
jgi:hypothetical protein